LKFRVFLQMFLSEWSKKRFQSLGTVEFGSKFEVMYRRRLGEEYSLQIVRLFALSSPLSALCNPPMVDF